MDPITVASRRFLAEAEAFWKAGRGPILPLLADASVRGDVVKSLRLAELAPDNKRPLFLFEAPFSGEREYFDALGHAIAADYEALRKGVGEEGVSLRPFSWDAPAARVDAMERGVLAMTHAAWLLGERFDGMTVALVPERVTAEAGWRDSIATLARMRFPGRLRLAVLAPPGGALNRILGAHGARFEVNERELADYLEGLGAGASAGPSVTEAGDALARGAGRSLRALLLEAGRKASEGEHAAAVERYSTARALCAEEGRRLDEALVLMMLAAAHVGAGAHEKAIASYGDAAAIAVEEGDPKLACTAWLGAGGSHLAAGENAAASVVYQAAANAAKETGIVALRVEALRMTGRCLLALGREEDAARVLREALALGEVDAGKVREAKMKTKT